MTYDLIKKENFYNTESTKFQLLELWKNRELCTMDMENKTEPYRHIFILNYNFFPLVYKDLKIFTNRNVYYTSAKFGFLPSRFLGSYQGKWITMSNEEFNRILKETIVSYDLLLDFDRPKNVGQWEQYEEEVYKVRDNLDLMKVKFIFNESKSGFHITIPYEVIKLPLEFNMINSKLKGEILVYYADLVKTIKKAFRLDFLCLANAGVFNRLQLSPYTICNNEKIITFQIYNKDSTEKEFKDFYNHFLRGVKI